MVHWTQEPIRALVVAEIKLVCESPPQWVDDLVDSGLLDETPKFSKFLHGTAYLRRAQIIRSKKASPIPRF